MEVLTTVEEKTENIVIANQQREFIENDKEQVSASYFVVCENTTFENLPKKVYELSACGLAFSKWVARACPQEPAIIKMETGESIIDALRSFNCETEYSVVLYASTPLVTKKHIIDLLGMVTRKHLSACKLKKGYIFRNDFIKRAEKLLSVDTYDLQSNDFFEVKNTSDLGRAQRILNKRLIDFHAKNQVEFQNENVNFDASVEIGANTSIFGGVSITDNSYVSVNCTINENAVIKNSKIEDGATICAGAVIKDSVIKSGATIGVGARVIGSVVGELSKIGDCSNVVRSGLKTGVITGECVNLVGARVSQGVLIKDGATVISSTENVVIMPNATIGVGAVICDKNIARDEVVGDFSRILKNTGDRN